MKNIKLFITNYLSINNFFNQQSNKNLIFQDERLYLLISFIIGLAYVHFAAGSPGPLDKTMQ